jgi:hypothetical protein
LGARIPTSDTTQPITFNDRDLQMSQSSLVMAKQERTQVTDPFASWHRLLFAMTYPLPKTTETVDLIKREIGERMHIRHDNDDEEADEQRANNNRGLFHNRELMRHAGMETAKTLAARSNTYIIGTSQGFEAVIVGLAAWIFCRGCATRCAPPQLT